VSTLSKVTVIGLVVVAVAAVLFLKAERRTSSGGAAVAVVEPQTLPRLLDLGSNQCIPCRMMAPILEELKRTHGGSFEVEVIDVREDRAAAGEHGIRVIPTQIFYDAGGRERFRHEGFMSREAILAQWEQLGVEIPAEPDVMGGDGR